jgi:hypothetical protein
VDEQWEDRRVTLVGTLDEVHAVCDQWRAEGWVIGALDAAPATSSGHECFSVAVRVPAMTAADGISPTKPPAELDTLLERALARVFRRPR